MIYICLFLLLFSCSEHYARDATTQLREGRFQDAEKKLSTADLHYTKSNDSALFLLSRAMVYFQSSQYDKCTQDFNKAFDAVDYYKRQSVPEIAGQTLIQDDIGAYVPPRFEESLARFYQALALLHEGQEDNARATVHYLENHVHPDDQNPLTTYLLAALFERCGDSSNARVLASRLHVEKTKGNVLIIHHLGASPQKKSQIAKSSIVSTAILEKILKVNDVKPALSTLAGVPIPILQNTTRPTCRLKIKDRLQNPTVSFDIARAAESHLDKEMPWTAARAAARILIRRGLVASTKDNYKPLVDIAMLISNIATKADTRSWTMLPSCIDLYHLDLEPGKHKIQAGRQSITITVKPKGLTIIDVFQPSSENIFTNKETL